MEKEKLQEAYEAVMLNEANEEIQLARALEKIFGVKVKNVDVKKTITIQFRPMIDNEEMENFSKIDAFEDIVKKKLKRAIVNWDNLTSIKIEEL